MSSAASIHFIRISEHLQLEPHEASQVSSGQSGYLCALEVLGLERNLSINGLYIKDSEVVLLRRKGC